MPSGRPPTVPPELSTVSPELPPGEAVDGDRWRSLLFHDDILIRWFFLTKLCMPLPKDVALKMPNNEFPFALLPKSRCACGCILNWPREDPPLNSFPVFLIPVAKQVRFLVVSGT